MHKIFTMSFSEVYPLYIQKVERKGRTKEELDSIIHWLTGYSREQMEDVLKNGTDFRTFFQNSPRMNPSREKITGVICGVRVEAIEDPLMREIRYLDKLVDELARGKSMDKILRN